MCPTFCNNILIHTSYAQNALQKIEDHSSARCTNITLKNNKLHMLETEEHRSFDVDHAVVDLPLIALVSDQASSRNISSSQTQWFN
jgi:hypothetical protein